MVVREYETSVLVGDVERTELPAQVEPYSSKVGPSLLTDWATDCERELGMELAAPEMVELDAFCSRYS